MVGDCCVLAFFWRGIFIGNVIELEIRDGIPTSSFYVAFREVWRTLKKLELFSVIASSNSYASSVLSKLPVCIRNSIYAR